MKLSFHGAARTVTGSKHLLQLDNGKKILFDCGLFQGLGRDTDGLNRDFGFNPAEIDVLLLSHAHIDHTGLIPKLVKEGFSGKIISTEATRELTAILLHDSAEIQTYEEYHNARREKGELAPPEPLYTVADAAAAMDHFETVPYNEWIAVTDGVKAIFSSTGHLIGCTAITIAVEEGTKKTTILYSGDVGRYRSVLLQPPAECIQADYVILESTYGDKHHDVSFNLIKSLRQWIEKICVEGGGKLIIPAFSVGRTQEILYALNQLSLEKRLPEIAYFIDSPLSLKATQTIKNHTELFNARLQEVLKIDDDPFEFPGLQYVETVEDSRKLVDYDKPCVIISASGTADAGRVRHHINAIIDKPDCAVLMSGYCGPKSLGGQLLSGAREVAIFGDPQPVLAQIGQLQGLSAHGDCDDLCRFLSCHEADRVKGIFLVHGEHTVQEAFCHKLESKGYRNIKIPAQHQEYDI
jgi:metallo-beta-lactamase family protein